MQRLPPTSYIAGNSFDVAVGQKLDLDAERLRLQSGGYRLVPQVLDPGDYAIRGGLLDVFPMGADEPYRVELLDDEIDSIRGFDPETQRSLDRVDAVRMLPGREVPLDEASTRRAMEALRDRFDIDTRRSALYQDLKAGLAPAGIEAWMPLFFEESPRKDVRAVAGDSRPTTATLFDYLGANTLPLLGDGIVAAAEHAWTQAAERHEQRRHDIERPLLPPAELWLSPEALRERFNAQPCIEICSKEHPRFAEAHGTGTQAAPELPLAPRGQPAGDAIRSFLGNYPGRVLVAADSAGRREALLEVMDAARLKPHVVADFASFFPSPLEGEDGPRPGEGGRFAIAVAPFDDGFALDAPQLCVLTERELFPERASQPRRRKRAGREPEAIIRDLGELAEGAPIVHEDHGVGRYRGLVTLEAGGITGE